MAVVFSSTYRGKGYHLCSDNRWGTKRIPIYFFNGKALGFRSAAGDENSAAVLEKWEVGLEKFSEIL